jgi:hypothetical protein
LQRTYQRRKQRFSRKTLRGGENTPEKDKPWHRRWITSPLKKKWTRAKQMYEGLRKTQKSENPGMFSRLKTRVNNFRFNPFSRQQSSAPQERPFDRDDKYWNNFQNNGTDLAPKKNIYNADLKVDVNRQTSDEVKPFLYDANKIFKAEPLEDDDISSSGHRPRSKLFQDF